MENRSRCTWWRALALAAPFGVALIAAPPLSLRAARAAEIEPSVGLTRSVGGDETKSQVGMALRGSLVPRLLQSEIAAGYRSEDAMGGDLRVKMWPVTVSALLTPIPTLHADAGVGWYNTTLDYRDPLLKDETKQKFGVHLGGGIKIPVAPVAALDLTGRYIWMKEQETRLLPGAFNPDFWTLSLGLAIGF